MSLKELKNERDKLREEISGKSVSSWKFWQIEQDNKLIRKMQRICDINNILKGSRMQKENADHDVCEICRTKRFDRGHCTKKVTCQDLKLIYNDGKSIFNDKEKKDLFTAI